MIKLTSVIFTFVILALSKAQVQVENFGECYTPNRERGLCVYLQRCTNLFNLYQKNPLHENDRQLLTRSQCGYYQGQVLVCCSRRSIKPDNAVTQTTTRQPFTNLESRGSLPNSPVCGGGAQDRITGGNKTKIDEFPWMVLLQYSKPLNKKGFHCGGSLINSRYVITAAHCVNGVGIPSDWSLTSVRLGEWDTSRDEDCDGDDGCSEPPIDVPIERRIPHPNYDPNARQQYNDIALLRLSRDVQYTYFIKPVCLPTANHLRNTDFNGVSLDVAGWGKTELGTNSNIKLKANVNGVNTRQCNAVYNSQKRNIQSTQLCAGGVEGIDSCRGDSGGPLVGFEKESKFPYYYLAGVVSYGPSPCGLRDWPGVYTRVSSYLDWIQQTIQS